MPALTNETKLLKARKAFADLAHEYTMQGKTKLVGLVQTAHAKLEENSELMIRLYDILTAPSP